MKRWRHRRPIEVLRKAHGGTWVYEPGATATYLHVESGRRVYLSAGRTGPFESDFELQLRWLDTQERAEFAWYRP